MLKVLKKVGISCILKIKGLFASFESQAVYVKDLRKVIVYKDGRKLKYPKNYDRIVKLGKIIKSEDSNNDSMYELCYDRYKYNLISVAENEKGNSFITKDGKGYFTIKFLVYKGKLSKDECNDNDDYCGFYKPFKFKKIDLVKYLPVFEIDTSSLKLINSSVLTKEEKNGRGEVHKVIDEKGRNGELLYTSDYKKLNTSFFEIRDQNNNLELDKSLISVPIVFIVGLVKICTKLLAFIPIKLGKCLISRQSPVVKSCGYLLFAFVIIVKNLVNMGATILKVIILLFVANKEKYGDAYLTMWNCQLSKCWEEFMKDFSVIKIEEREEKLGNMDNRKIIGTWRELNAKRLFIEKSLKNEINESNGSISQSREQSLKKEKLQNEISEGMAEFSSQRNKDFYVRREKSRRGLHQKQDTMLYMH
ncbi:hypothetical protein GOY14_02265 [Wolbachia endosymbiont of Dipetalonema caudispina]|uniref:hypothetical protein n=1 Tax=Wolbachia endosymbiont of Dipetalonema caudispina TaxID=1812112 RepID=UPI00158A9EB6|nr:hypothetical protein [Wolbachia endosymbiont of Dipetalonema caudispina]QKX01148.1 hypothetical protein GOY14_02265 [Wolbachia endosymbiont of Dipetalonema caudispina]